MGGCPCSSCCKAANCTGHQMEDGHKSQGQSTPVPPDRLLRGKRPKNSFHFPSPLLFQHPLPAPCPLNCLPAEVHKCSLLQATEELKRQQKLLHVAAGAQLCEQGCQNHQTEVTTDTGRSPLGKATTTVQGTQSSRKPQLVLPKRILQTP